VSETDPRLAAVSRIAQVASASLELDELMEVVYDAIAPFFRHEQYTVLEYLHAKGSLRTLFGVEAGERSNRDVTEVARAGLSHTVATRGRPLYVPDLEHRDPSVPEPVTIGYETPIASWLGVPIRIRDQVIGVLSLGAVTKDAYPRADQALLLTVADLLGMAIENARLFEATRRQAERMGLLNRVSKAVSATLEPDRLLEALYAEIAPAFEHDELLVVLHRPETDEIELIFGMLGGRRVPRARHPLGGLTGEVIRRRTTLHIRNYEAEKDSLPTPYFAEGEERMPASWLGAPLIVGERVLGAICIMLDRPNAYDAERQRLFETLADQIAFALHNASTFQAARDAAEQLAIVNRIGRLVGQEHDLEQLGLAVHRAIAPVFEPDSFFIALVDETDQTIEFPFMIDEGVRTPSDPIPLGEGLTSTVLRTQRMLHVHNELEYGEAIGNPSLFGSMKAPQSWLGIPLLVGGRVIGVVNVQSYRPHAFTEEQALLLSTIADQIATSFDKAQLYQAAQREIEERRRAEARLDQERTLLRTIIDHLPDFIYAKDLEGRFVVASTAIARFFGCETPEQLLGKTLGDFLPAALAAGYLEEDRRILASGTPLLNAEESVVDRSTGVPRWLLVTKLPLANAHGETIGLVGIDRDITARKQAEQKVKRYVAEVEVANEEIKQFAYIVSHDLRAPLVNLKGFSAELTAAMKTLAPYHRHLLDRIDQPERQRIAQLLDEDIPEALGFIETSVSRMDGFIRSVLKLSRIGRRELSPRPVDVAALVEACRQSLAHQMEERRVELIVHDLPEVVADPTAMEQIVGNLLTNAVNYLDPERPGRIEIGGERGPLVTRFWIADNGRGIAQEDEEKVFAPFRRAGVQDVVGEGMGLSYVRTMVRRHGGQIGFESEPGVGTTFSFTLANPEEKGRTDGKPE